MAAQANPLRMAGRRACMPDAAWPLGDGLSRYERVSGAATRPSERRGCARPFPRRRTFTHGRPEAFSAQRFGCGVGLRQRVCGLRFVSGHAQVKLNAASEGDFRRELNAEGVVAVPGNENSPAGRGYRFPDQLRNFGVDRGVQFFGAGHVQNGLVGSLCH